jgi:hypothetical protein
MICILIKNYLIYLKSSEISFLFIKINKINKKLKQDNQN